MKQGTLPPVPLPLASQHDYSCEHHTARSASYHGLSSLVMTALSLCLGHCEYHPSVRPSIALTHCPQLPFF